MTKLTQYVEAFWGKDYTSIAGFEVLSKHNSEQKKFLNDFEDYLRKRAKLESEYSKSLGSLSKSMRDRPNATGVLEMAWNTLHSELDACRRAHDDANLFYSQHAEETKRFTREMTARRDTAEERLKKVQSQKYHQFKNVNSLGKTYRGKCQDNDQQTEAYNILRRGVTSTVKELDKAKTKMEKAEDESTKADASYKSAVNMLEEIRLEWEREMERACKEFQEGDEEQVTFLRSELWHSVNRVSQVALEVDESCERVRSVLETCDVDQDVQNFIALNSTGTERPEPIPYQNYYEPGGTSTPPARRDGSPRLPAIVPTLPNSNAAVFYSEATDDSLDPTYATADATYSLAETPSAAPARLLTVVKSFQQAGSDFAVQAGDRVTFLKKPSSHMITVRTHNGKTGNLPAGCLKEQL